MKKNMFSSILEPRDCCAIVEAAPTPEAMEDGVAFPIVGDGVPEILILALGVLVEVFEVKVLISALELEFDIDSVEPNKQIQVSIQTRVSFEWKDILEDDAEVLDRLIFSAELTDEGREPALVAVCVGCEELLREGSEALLHSVPLDDTGIELLTPIDGIADGSLVICELGEASLVIDGTITEVDNGDEDVWLTTLPNKVGMGELPSISHPPGVLEGQAGAARLGIYSARGIPTTLIFCH